MSRGVLNDPCDAEPNYVRPSKNVDEALRGLGELANAALQSLETSVAFPSKKTHDDVLRANTGWAMDPVSWSQRQAASAELERQTAHIADALAGAGVNVVLDGDVTFIGAVTGVVEQQRVYRACRFLPTVAARDRRPTVNGLKLFISGHKHSKYFRYAVMTCSEPVRFSPNLQGDMRGAIQELNRRISRWAHNAQKKYGVEVLYRGIEFTRATAAERDAEAHARGQPSNLSERYGAATVLYHVHANVLYWPTRVLKEKGKTWEDFLRFTHEATGAWWKDNGKVEAVEELVKYCSKPNDTLKSSADELVWLYHATQRLKLCQPLGEFKVWMKALEAAGEKVVRVHVGRGDGRLMRVKKRQKADKDSKDGEAETDTAASEDDDKSDAATDVEKKAPPSNMLLGMTLPQWRHSPWAEPLIMVQRYDPSKSFGEAGGDIEAWKRAAREMWDENFGPEPEEALRVAQMAREAVMSSDDIREAAEAAEAYIVHTCRPTVPAPGNADEEVPPEELDDDLREVVSLFEGGTVVRLAPRPPAEDDEIPFESPVVAARWAKMRADLAASEARWAEWRASAAHVPRQSSEHGCRNAA
ncbi:hypothetical protein [Agrobacterium larrymoorei]|uniref:Uncharacterized protein n=1 Tax=Agrobacterium larrymoorei TaxID=160699 RepID=A0AAF0HAR5_9HYPH|nr:hypothetical protein [Agrobacterium larrymoorei]WHA42976.1 hypothetical protein CFBP5477_017070 [Agrobacterium larrymoorei]